VAAVIVLGSLCHTGDTDEGDDEADGGEGRHADLTRRPEGSLAAGGQRGDDAQDQHDLHARGHPIGEADGLLVVETLDEADARDAADPVSDDGHTVHQRSGQQQQAMWLDENGSRPGDLEDGEHREDGRDFAYAFMALDHGGVQKAGSERQQRERCHTLLHGEQGHLVVGTGVRGSVDGGHTAIVRRTFGLVKGP
jgi:hypothetical protein